MIRIIILLLRLFYIDNYVETGTFKGCSLRALLPWFPSSAMRFWSVEINHDYYSEAKKNITDPRVTLVNNTSVNFFKANIHQFQQGNTLFYLDAHWLLDCPLREEIKQALKLDRSIIVIDDFAVPFRLDMGFDAYLGGSLCWFYVRDLFRGRKISVYYPRMANHYGQGQVFIFVGYEDCQLESLSEFKGLLYSPRIKGEPIMPMLAWLRCLCVYAVKFVFFRREVDETNADL